MIKISVVKVNNKYFIEISEEIAKYLGQNINITKTNDGILIKKDKNVITKEEFSVLKKLNSFKFEKRIPSEVNKILTKYEKDALDSLISKKTVSIYKEGKYKKTGVYSISQSIYPRLLNKNKEVEKKGVFGNDNYLIITDENEAKRISNQLKEEIKNRDIRGTRGFDGKFYIATKEFYEKYKLPILKILEGKNLKLSEISSNIKIPETACLVALRLLDEDGEILEKKKNVFCLI